MLNLANKPVLVLGLGGRGRAACELLRRAGAIVVAADSADTPDLHAGAKHLRSLGIEVALGVAVPPRGDFALVVVSPAVRMDDDLVQAVMQRKLPILGEMEFGFQHAKCLSIAIAGTNGKGTTAELVERVLASNHRKTVFAGHQARPVCSVVEQTRDLDFLILQINAFQLELTRFFRPSVAVLMNLAPDHLDRYATADDYVLVDSRGTVHGKAEVLRQAADPGILVAVNEPHDHQVRLYGEVAVVIARLDQRGTDHGRPYDIPVRFTDVWVRREGRWVCTSGHASRLG